MKQSLRSSVNIFYYSLLFSGLVACGTNHVEAGENLPLEEYDTRSISAHSNQLLVIVDQSPSMKGIGTAAQTNEFLQQEFEKTYKHVFSPTNFLVAEITGQTNVVPKHLPFHEALPDLSDEPKIKQVEKKLKYQTNKRKWKNDIIQYTATLVHGPKSGSTDVYSSLNSIQDAWSKMHKRDTLRVVFFSDLKQSTKGFELETLLKNNDPVSFANAEYQRLKKHLGLSPLQRRAFVEVTVRTPDQFSNSGRITLFWKNFFNAWGIPEMQVNFKR